MSLIFNRLEAACYKIFAMVRSKLTFEANDTNHVISNNMLLRLAFVDERNLSCFRKVICHYAKELYMHSCIHSNVNVSQSVINKLTSVKVSVGEH